MTQLTVQIAATSDDRIAIWEQTINGTYRVHSILSTGFIIKCLQLSESMLVAGGESLAVFCLTEETGLPVWRRSWQKQ